MNFEKEFELMKKNLMKYIYYHRFGKRLRFNLFFSILNFFIILIIAFFLSFYKYDEINHFFISFLSKYFDEYVIENLFINFGFYTINLHYLIIPGRFPNNFEILVSLLFISILGLLLFIYRRKILPFFMWYVFFSIPFIVSVFYFTFFKNYFPYTVREFSILYTLLQYGITVFFVFIIAVSISVISFSFWTTFTNIIFTFLLIFYIFLFGYLRYFVFLLVLSKMSYLYMANLFFTFGPLLDFLYFTSFYSLYVSLLMKSIMKDSMLWKFVS